MNILDFYKMNDLLNKYFGFSLPASKMVVARCLKLICSNISNLVDFSTAGLALPNQVASVCKIKVVSRRTSERRIGDQQDIRNEEGGQAFLIRVSFINQYYYNY